MSGCAGPRGRGLLRAAWAGLASALVALGVIAAPVHAATPEQIRECVLENQPRYSTPGSAITAQYLALADLCRAAIDGEREVQVQIMPEGGQALADGGSDPSPTGDPSSDDAPGASASGGPQGPSGPGAARAEGSRETAPAQPAVARVETASREGESAFPVGDPFGGMPWWMLALLAGFAAVALGRVGVALGSRLR